VTIETTVEMHVDGRLPVLMGAYLEDVSCELRLVKNGTVSTEIAARIELAAGTSSPPLRLTPLAPTPQR
jgi:hypothetical protein